MGHEVSSEIEELFDEKEFALGAMLDAVASLATDKAAEVLEANMQRDFLERGLIADDHVVLGYSPGYCGWHLSGQKKLFEYLEPERIQVTLNDSFLMSPLKSVSGVLVAGEVGVHLFDNSFPFCRECKTRSCRLRMSRLSVGRTP